MILFDFLRDITIFSAILVSLQSCFLLLVAALFPLWRQLRKYRMVKSDMRWHGQVRAYKPVISVIIPAWNEEVGVLKTVRSVLANTYSKVEIIIVNDGSTDNSRSIIDAFIKKYEKVCAKYGRTVTQYYIENRGKGGALNYGIQHANGEIVLTIDADSALATNAITKLVEHFKDPEVFAVVGQVRIANVKGRVIGLVQEFEYLFRFYIKRAHCVLGAEYMYDGACAAFRRNLFDRFGLFDEKNKTEDIEMSVRTKYYGLQSRYAEDVLCYTEGPSTYASLLRQRLRWKKGRLDTFLRYREMFFSRSQQHNKALGWFILPFSLLSELKLILEPFAIILLVTYGFLTNDFSALAMSMLFIGGSYVIVACFGAPLTVTQRLRLILLWPITWAPFYYVFVWIELQALVRSLHMIMRGQTLEWQKWQREGI